jgi:hypothetical protein
MLDHHRALIYTMVIVSAAESELPDAELRVIGDIVEDLPVFRGFDRRELPRVDQRAMVIEHECPLADCRMTDQNRPGSVNPFICRIFPKEDGPVRNLVRSNQTPAEMRRTECGSP